MFYLLFIGDHIHSDWSTILLGFVSNLPFSVWRVDISIKHINQLVVHEWRIITLNVFTFTLCNESYIYFICREHTKIHLFFFQSMDTIYRQFIQLLIFIICQLQTFSSVHKLGNELGCVNINRRSICNAGS